MADTQSQRAANALIGISALLGSLADNWWLVLLRGFAAIAFGILAFIWPGLTVVTLTYVWGIYTLADGILALGAAMTGRSSTIAPRWWLALAGICGVLSGIIAFSWPGMTTLILLMFIAVWAIAVGILQIFGAILLRKEIDGEWWLGLSGLLSIAFGALVMAWPGAGALSVVWIIGWYALLAGGCLVALAFRLRSFKRKS